MTKGPIPAYLFDFIYLCSLMRDQTCYRLSDVVLDSFHMSEYCDAAEWIPNRESFTSFLAGVNEKNILSFSWQLM